MKPIHRLVLLFCLLFLGAFAFGIPITGRGEEEHLSTTASVANFQYKPIPEQDRTKIIAILKESGYDDLKKLAATIEQKDSKLKIHYSNDSFWGSPAMSKLFLIAEATQEVANNRVVVPSDFLRLDGKSKTFALEALNISAGYHLHDATDEERVFLRDVGFFNMLNEIEPKYRPVASKLVAKLGERLLPKLELAGKLAYSDETLIKELQLTPKTRTEAEQVERWRTQITRFMEKYQ